MSEKRVFGPRGTITEYRGFGINILETYQRGLSLDRSGKETEIEPGMKITGPYERLYVIDERPFEEKRKIYAVTKDNFPVEFDLMVIIKPANIRKVIKNAPVDLIEQVHIILGSGALRSLYAQEDLSCALEDCSRIEAKVQSLLDETLAKWGYGTDAVRIDNFTPPKEFIELSSRRAVLPIKREVVLSEREIKLATDLIDVEYEAKKRSIIGETEIELKRKQGLAEAEIIKSKGLADVDVQDALWKAKLPYMEKQYEFLGELLDRIADKYGANAPEIIWGIFSNNFGTSHPVTEAIARQMGMKYQGKGVSKFSTEASVSPNTLIWTDVLKNSNLLALANVGQLSEFDRKLRKELYDK